MPLILGVDPGRNGALAVLSDETRDGAYRVQTHDMPDTASGLHSLLLSLPPVAFAAVEKPFYPRQIGATNVARIAEAYGALKSALLFCGIPQREVRPAEWKAALNLGPNKAASRERASMLFPDDGDQWVRAKDDGRAEAALIAWYGRKFK